MANVEALLRSLAKARAPKSICPSEVARAISPSDVHSAMQAVRRAAAKLAKRGEVVVTQKRRPVDIASARGPVRITFVRDGVSYADHYRGTDFRKHPELYRVGRGEQGVLIAEPYKTELLPKWRFRTPEIARKSAAALWRAFVRYRRANDFVGMDMARKFIQMGFTRARRYARHASGRKYGGDGHELQLDVSKEKNHASAIFKETWDRVEADKKYVALRKQARAVGQTAESDTRVHLRRFKTRR